MKLKIFGKEIFDIHKGNRLAELGLAKAKESKFLPDFKKLSGANSFSNTMSEFIAIDNYSTNSTAGSTVESNVIATIKAKTKPKNKAKKVKKKTPKEIFELKMLNDQSFKINTDEKYVDDLISDFSDKLALIKAEEHDMENGIIEISSMLTRMLNRKKYAEHEKFFSEYAYTTNERIAKLIKSHDYLKMDVIAKFIADMPREALQTIKAYEKETIALCGKKPVFYIIADKDDFKKADKRRDPILLAQSPYGHFWQILGAWDKEMLYLAEL